MTCGGALLTATVGGLTPTSASDDSRRSSEMVFTPAANFCCSSVAYPAPWFGSVGNSLFVIFRFSNTTVRMTLSTCVRAVAKTTPNVSSLVPVGLMASAHRKSIWLSTHLLTCGWYTSTAAFERLISRGQGSAGSCVAAEGLAAAGAWPDATKDAQASANRTRARGSVCVTFMVSPVHFGNISCTWARICQLAPKSGRTTL